MVTVRSEAIDLLQSALRKFITGEVIPLHETHGLDADQASEMQRLTIARRVLKG